jgi:protein transport protein SEC13
MSAESAAPATAAEQVVETGHGDIVHDTQFDYYGRYLATCSSDKSVRVFRAADGQPIAHLVGHAAPVWMVSWAPPEFGTALASCGYDGKVIVWKEAAPQWRPSHVIGAGSHTGSVNGIAWAPACRSDTATTGAVGAAIASAGSDGRIVVTSCIGGVWHDGVNLAPAGATVAHPTGALCVSFATDVPLENPEEGGPACTFLASAGCDQNVRVWAHPGSAASAEAAAQPQWAAICSIGGDHREWVRDVAFSPDASSRWLVLASCSEDKTVVVRRTLRVKAEEAALAAAHLQQHQRATGRPNNSAANNAVAAGQVAIEWEKSPAIVLPSAVWRLSWSPDGTMLLATTGDSQAFMLKPGASFKEPWSKSPVNAQ